MFTRVYCVMGRHNTSLWPYATSSLFSSDGFGSQVDLLLSQEIDLAMKRHAHSSPGSPGDGGRGAGLRGCGGEEFPEENIHSWECGIEPGQQTK